MKAKKALSSLLAAGALAGSLVGLSATSASAANVCNTSYVIQNNSSGEGEFISPTTVRVKPYTECGKVGTFVKGTTFYYWCYVNNSYGNKWIYGRMAGTETKGWVYDTEVMHTKGTLKKC